MTMTMFAKEHRAEKARADRASIEERTQEAERKAWLSLARSKYLMFGYHAAIWVNLVRHVLHDKTRPSPFRKLVGLAKSYELRVMMEREGIEPCGICEGPHDEKDCEKAHLYENDDNRDAGIPKF